MTTLKQQKTGNKLNQAPGLFRYLAIICYDTLLLIALLFLATALILPLNQGEAFAANQYFFPVYIIGVCFWYYGWFWTHGGQTLGMKTWKVKLQTIDKQAITWHIALKRFFLAIISWGTLGLGVLWKLVDKNQQTLHDNFSGTGLFFDKNN